MRRLVEVVPGRSRELRDAQVLKAWAQGAGLVLPVGCRLVPLRDADRRVCGCGAT